MIESILKIHKDPENVDFKKIWSDGVFIFDSNVLLDLYRLPESATKDLIGVLNNKDFNKKVWIGFQGLLEFLNNRHAAISEQKSKFHTVRKLIIESIGQYDEVFDALTKELSGLKLKQRHSLIDPDKFLTPDKINNGKLFLEQFLEELSKLEGKQSDVNDEDKIKGLVLDIFKGKIGEGFNKKELEDIYKDGEKRYENEIPPGYKDKAKKGTYRVEDREFIRKYGDLILWKEILRKANLEKISHIVLVTGDVKEDWWVEKSGKKLGPRKELLNEIYMHAPDLQTFYMYDTSSFLRHAKSELHVDISDSSINQTKDLIEISRENRAIHDEEYIYIVELIRACSNNFAELTVALGNSLHALPSAKLNKMFFYSAITEILANVLVHGFGNMLWVNANHIGGHVSIIFRNRLKNDIEMDKATDDLTHINLYESGVRGYGLKMIKDSMIKNGIDVRIEQSDRYFIVELLIPSSFFINLI